MCLCTESTCSFFAHVWTWRAGISRNTDSANAWIQCIWTWGNVDHFQGTRIHPKRCLWMQRSAFRTTCISAALKNFRLCFTLDGDQQSECLLSTGERLRKSLEAVIAGLCKNGFARTSQSFYGEQVAEKPLLSSTFCMLCTQDRANQTWSTWLSARRFFRRYRSSATEDCTGYEDSVLLIRTMIARHCWTMTKTQ